MGGFDEKLCFRTVLNPSQRMRRCRPCVAGAGTGSINTGFAPKPSCTTKKWSGSAPFNWIV